MVVAALSDRWRKLMSQLTIDTSSNSKISLNTREELREALHNESTRSYASTFDITDDIGVLEDSVFETGNLAPGISGSGLFPAQLRKMVLRTLFIMVAAYLTVLVLMVGVAILVDEVRYYLTTYRTIAYLLFLLLPLVHCIWMLRSPARSTFVLPLFVIILGYVESVLSCVYNTYCIFITNVVCLATCTQTILLSYGGVELISRRTLVFILFLHAVNMIVVCVTICSTTLCSQLDLAVAAAAVVVLPGVIAFKIRIIIKHFSPSNYV